MPTDESSHVCAPRQVVLIMTDTQRWDMLGCYRNTGLLTPNLDRLAEGGVRFNRAYNCQPVCGPARSAIFTGTFPHTNGSWANSMPLGDNVKTVGQRLRDNAVHAAYIGKWHLDGGDYFGLGRCPDGWDPDYWYDMRNYLEELTPRERRISRMPPSRWTEPIEESFTFAHRCSNRAVDFLDRFGEQDFFLVVSYDEPHGPFLAPQRYSEMYRDFEFPKDPGIWDSLQDKPAHQRVWRGEPYSEQKADELRIRRADYFGCNTFADHEIGRVLEAIESRCPQALVIYTSDHGDALHSHGINNKGPATYEEIVRVPLLVRWPGHAPQGAVSDSIFSHVDITCSVLDAFGLPQPPMLEGVSQLPTFAEPTATQRDACFIEFGRYETDHDGFGGFQPLRSICDGRYKLTVNLLTSDELYDLETDPCEVTNLINSPDHAQARDALHDRLLNWMNETRDPFRGYYWERRPWRQDAARATWRYTGMTRQREEEDYEPRQLDYDTGLEMEEAVRLK